MEQQYTFMTLLNNDGIKDSLDHINQVDIRISQPPS